MTTEQADTIIELLDGLRTASIAIQVILVMGFGLIIAELLNRKK